MTFQRSIVGGFVPRLFQPEKYFWLKTIATPVANKRHHSYDAPQASWIGYMSGEQPGGGMYGTWVGWLLLALLPALPKRLHFTAPYRFAKVAMPRRKQKSLATTRSLQFRAERCMIA